MIYQFKLDKFEGPLDLLLELIEKERLDITELSLANVTNQYLDHIKSTENIHLENLAEFLSVASKLILIKSRALLPMLQFSEEEEAEIKDLTEQLAAYKKFKEAADVLGKIAQKGQISYTREGFKGVESFFYPPENINAFDLKKYFSIVIAEIPIVEKLEEEIVREVMTLEEKINDLQNMLRQKVETSFAELTASATDKIDVIVSFLAMLEMVKQRIVQVEQRELFEEIKLRVKTTN